MNKIITYETLRNFTYSNDSICQTPIKRIVICFNGLGGMTMYKDHSELATELANEGIIYINPYLNPWNWMNKEGCEITNEIIDVLFEKYHLAENTPIISSGGSMGGLCSLVYPLYASRKVTAVVANCPVCDLPYHYTERPDLPRTLYSAFYNYDGEIVDALKTASPIHLASILPDIPYCIFHCEEDHAVNIHKHSETFVAEMNELKRNIKFIKVPNQDHCQLPDEVRKEYNNYLKTIK